MEIGSKLVYIGNTQDDYEEIKMADGLALSDSDCSDEDGETCVLDILDASRQDEYSSLRDHYVKTADGFIIVYSIADQHSLKEAESVFNWLKRVRDDNPKTILVANKQDLCEQAVLEGSLRREPGGNSLIDKECMDFYEHSNKDGNFGKHSCQSDGNDHIQMPKVHDLSLNNDEGSGTKVESQDVQVNARNDEELVPMTQMPQMGIVSHCEGQERASKMGVPFYESSAKSGVGVQAAFRALVKLIPRTSSSYRIVVLGAGSVGKSSFTLRFVNDAFHEDYETGFESTFRKMISVSGLQIVLKDQKKMFKKSRRGPSSTCTRPSTPQGATNVAPCIIHAHGGFLPGGRPISGTKNPTMVVKERKEDGNVILLPLGTLANEPNIVTGDPIRCRACGAVLSSTSSLTTDGDDRHWMCEFCGEKNSNLDVTDEEIPKENVVDFLVSLASGKMEKDTCGDVISGSDSKMYSPRRDGTLVLCIDTSFSMSKAVKIPESQAAWEEENGAGRKSTTRLECIQEAIRALVKEMKIDQRERRVLLVAFGSIVEVKAGGGFTQRPPRFHDIDQDFPALLRIGKNLTREYKLSHVEYTAPSLISAVNKLRPSGGTALGPALSICAGFLSSHPGSEIILCTDGQPKKGVGSDGCAEFYEKIGKYAQSNNITINIMALEGAPAGLSYVRKAAEFSGGTTTKLNPMELGRQLRLIGREEVIGTDVSLRLYIHPDFAFNEPGFPRNVNQIHKHIGSVKRRSDLTFKFRLKDNAPESIQKVTSIPFQAQIEYTRPDGRRCLRVLSKSCEATADRKAMEDNINVSIVGVSAMKSSAAEAQAGNNAEAQRIIKKAKRLVCRGARSVSQREERLAFESEVSRWDEHLSANHERLDAGLIRDGDVYMLDLASRARLGPRSGADV